MRFILIDKIIHFEKEKSLIGLKTVSLAEEYLKDHFPQKPVLPGVLMLEALVQASAWLVRLSSGFTHSVITLVQAKTIRYGKFVSPGDVFEVETLWKKAEDDFVELSAKGSVAGEQVVSAKLKLEQKNLAQLNPKFKIQDEELLSFYKGLYQQIVAKDFQVDFMRQK